MRRFVCRDRIAGRRGDPARQLESSRQQLVRRVDAADDAQPQGGEGVVRPARQGHLGGYRRRQRRPRRRVAGRDAAGQLGEAEGRLLGGEPEVAEQGQREAPRERRTVDGGDRRPRAPRDRAEAGDAGLDQLLPVGTVAAELGHVHARAERRPGAGEGDAADPVVVAERTERVGELDAQLDRERVALIGTLQGEHRDRLAPLDREQAGHLVHPMARQLRRLLRFASGGAFPDQRRWR